MPRPPTRSRPEQSAATSSRPEFRNDIQGVRGLAFIGVLVFHAGIAPYPGGFVALDVFFVLSGFLITTLLVREIQRSGTVSLSRFYARRARRILPAAAVATVGTVVASWLWLNLVQAREAAFDAVWAALFGANIRFALQETDYFAENEPASPLLHYWSLSVEEQFYLVLPALLLGCILLVGLRQRRAKLGGPRLDGPRRRASRDPIPVITVALAVVTLLSLAWSFYNSPRNPDSAYFSTLTRTWEFGLGALLAICAPRLTESLTGRSRNLLMVTGLGMVVVAMFTLTESMAYPGWVALLPTVGTGVIMVAGAELGEQRMPVVQRLVGIRPLRVLGDASYSLYLWHWPVLVIASQYVGRDLRPVELALATVVIFVMGWVSYRIVETPFRRGIPPRFGKGLILYPVALTLAVGSSLVAIVGIDQQVDSGNPAIRVGDYDRSPAGKEISSNRAVARVQASARAAVEGAPIPGDLSPPLTELKTDKADVGECEYKAPPYQLCRRGDPDAEKTIVVLGNSHGRHWIPAFEKIARQQGYAVYYLVKSRCTPARVDLVLPDQQEPWEVCLQFNKWAQQQLERIRPNLVVISSSGVPGVMVDGEVVRNTDAVVAAMRKGFEKLLADAAPTADRVTLLSDIPRRRDGGPGECLSRRGATLKDCLSKPDPRAARIAEASREVARASKTTDLVDTRGWFCADGRCPAVVGSTITLRDRNHLSTAYAEQLARPLARKLRLRDN